MPGFCFSKTDWVSGIIWPVISGLETTATVTVPVPLLVPEPLPLPEPPPLEHAATAVTAATAHAAATRLCLPILGFLNLDELMNEPPQR